MDFFTLFMYKGEGACTRSSCMPSYPPVLHLHHGVLLHRPCQGRLWAPSPLRGPQGCLPANCPCHPK
jgi:hypothetical protein